MKTFWQHLFNPTGSFFFWGVGGVAGGCFAFYVRGFVRTLVTPVLCSLICHTAQQPMARGLLEPEDCLFKLTEHFNVL